MTSRRRQAFYIGSCLIAVAIGWTYYLAKVYPQAQLEGALQKARTGDVQAMMDVGDMYLICDDDFRWKAGAARRHGWSGLALWGFYARCDVTKGRAWYTAAAASGNATAEYRLFLLQSERDGGPDPKDMKLLKKAATDGSVEAQTIWQSLKNETQ